MGVLRATSCVSLLWIIVSLDCITSNGESGKYLGCFTDEENPRTFVGYAEYFGEDLTPQKCNQHCFKKGFLYSATQSRTFCFCNDKPPNPSSKTSEDHCSKPCAGNATEKCGGDKSLAVRRTGIPDFSEATQYVGCYYNAYGLPNEVLLIREKTNSPRRCMNICLEKGYKYAGVQQSKECHCATDPPDKLSVVDGQECRWPCPGDPSQSCGAGDRIAVYTTVSREGSTQPRKKKFHVENRMTANWHEALMACARNGMRLASIDRIEELDQIKQIIRQLGRRLGQYWTAGSDVGSEGSFYWATTGKELSSTSDWWLIESHHRQPDNWEGHENCVEVWERFEWQGYGLNDRPCSDKVYYVCESFVD